MHQKNHQARSLALFCKVIDNYGDIGICWRLALQLEREHGIAVTLWVDDLVSFQRICPEVVINCDVQHIGTIIVRHWLNQDGVFAADDVTDIVIEFFGCDIPPVYILAMAQRAVKPAWINLEGLTAEQWVEGCHRLPSSHPSLPLKKYFFYPGFTELTGGLLIESNLTLQRQKFQQDPAAMTAFLGQFGVTAAEMTSLKVSLFCYPQAPVAALFNAWECGATAVTCLVPEGVAADAVQLFLGQSAKAGATATRGALTVRVMPFVPQSDYDKLLWACDLNFVRGEDSFVRAQWAGQPFIWHIYPQDNDLHHVKLNAFLQRYKAKTQSLVDMSLNWNAVKGVVSPHELASTWLLLQADLPKIAALTSDWQQNMLANGNFTANLLKFIDGI
ncbi:elongation factor P maturation arginine rhamnosyltransferase EarP [Solimicrobium silvestre]|uniref:Protein-arginine rhamnosyltransferase n=1 Tax=Solimicrobium silvestre TaxID=2099400 RepID=A0A2S9GZF8_9BURK|nr:elongation factor P maturation arginine rhamnosyltransferase EarP [Solimicrobium silvestre]PRC93114.1 Conserved hypothetical protein, PP_1857 family [Solimicrobium silvestre]